MTIFSINKCEEKETKSPSNGRAHNWAAALQMLRSCSHREGKLKGRLKLSIVVSKANLELWRTGRGLARRCLPLRQNTILMTVVHPH